MTNKKAQDKPELFKPYSNHTSVYISSKSPREELISELIQFLCNENLLEKFNSLRRGLTNG